MARDGREGWPVRHRLSVLHLACRPGTVEPNLAVNFAHTSDHSLRR